MGDGRLLSTSDVDIMYKSYGYHPPIKIYIILHNMLIKTM